MVAKKNKSNLFQITVYYGKQQMMKRTIFLLILIFGAFIIRAQEEPQEVKSIVKEVHDYEWYTKQYSLWGKEIKKDKKDGEAWLNLYTAARMARISSLDVESRDKWAAKELEVVNNMSKSIKDSFYYYRIMAWYHSVWQAENKEEVDKIITYVENAHELRPNESDIYPNLMNIYEIARPDLAKQKELSKLWKASAYHTPKLMALSYNVLMNASKNALLITGGDNDTYPLWIIQHGDEFRKDVKVLNVSLLQIKEYRNRLFKEVGIPAMEEEYYQSSEILDHIIKNRGDRGLYFYNKGIAVKDSAIFEKLYNVGVIYKYAEETFNNSALIVHHFENKFIVDQLKYDYYQSEFPKLDQQWDFAYLPGLVSLYQHYELIGNDEKAKYTQELILRLGEDFPNLDAIKREIGLD